MAPFMRRGIILVSLVAAAATAPTSTAVVASSLLACLAASLAATTAVAKALVLAATFCSRCYQLLPRDGVASSVLLVIDRACL